MKSAGRYNGAKMTDRETALLDRAQRGDRLAASELFESCRRPLFAYILRMVAHRTDAEDLLQDVLLRACETLPAFRREAKFRTWLFAIASHVCLDYLRVRRRWRPEAQRISEDHAREEPSVVERLHAVVSEPGFQFEVREHIAYCVACVSRSLEPEQQAALLLREMFGFSAAEGARALGVSQPVFNHRLAAARATLAQAFEGLCALIGKQGVCWQCRSLREFAPPDKRGPDLVRITPASGSADAGALLAARLAIARSADLEFGKTRKLHDWFFEATSRQEEQGLPFR